MILLIGVLATLFLVTLLLLPVLYGGAATRDGNERETQKSSDETLTEPERNLRDTGKMVLPPINFRPNEAEIDSPSAALREQLALIQKYMRTAPNLRLKITGHTDRQGGAEHNRALSLRRAQAICKLLITEYGVSEKRLRAAGAGFSEPVADDTTADGRRRNRRVEIEIEKNS